MEKLSRLLLIGWLAAIGSVLAVGCDEDNDGDDDDGDESLTQDDLSGPGRFATDTRVPELPNLRDLSRSAISMGDAVAQVEEEDGAVIEAKYELDHDGKLALSIYPVGNGIDADSERNVFQERAGDPTVLPFSGNLETFEDQEHLTRSSRDLTLVQLSALSISDAIYLASWRGFVYWAIPTIRLGRAGYGVYTWNGRASRYQFIDGNGPRKLPWIEVSDLGDGPGDGASDARVPELGEDPSVVLSAKIGMLDALLEAEEEQGATIEAKYELDHDGKLALSIYPVGEGIDTDAENNRFFELAGDPTADDFAPSLSEFTPPDAEHLTRSARDLTIVQTANLSLVDAVYVANYVMPDGFVFWAIPTIRDTTPGYGVYVLDGDGSVHYLFID